MRRKFSLNARLPAGPEAATPQFWRDGKASAPRAASRPPYRARAWKTPVFTIFGERAPPARSYEGPQLLLAGVKAMAALVACLDLAAGAQP